MMISPAVAPAFKPTLAIRVGFAGHRDLARVGGETAATTATVTILEILKAAVADLSGRTVSDSEVFADLYAHRGLRLVTGLAPGADQLMIRQWRAAGFSDVHGVLPYLDAEGQRPITDRPEFASSKDLTIDLALTDSWTALDTDAAGDGHAEVSRCIVRHSDMLIVFWDGKVGGGPGGTAHSVGLALAKTIPVVWLRPDGAPPVLLAADEWDREALVEGLRTPERYAGELRSSALADALTVGLLPPWSADRGVGGNDPEVASRRDYVQRDPLRFANSAARILDAALRRSLWSSFDWFERTIGGSNGENKSATRPPAPCPVAGQAGYELLANEFAIADERAQRLGAVHRSEQLILLVLAVLAVAAAAIPSAFADRLATWPPFAVAGAAEAKDRVHFFALVTEFGFAVLALGIWSLARRAHRHRRWSDARRLAERLRAAVAIWPLGIDIADQRSDAPQTWTEWRARTVVAAAGIPTGVFTDDEVQRRKLWAERSLLQSQRDYHRREASHSRAIVHALHALENGLFWILMASLFIGVWVSWLLGWGHAAASTHPALDTILRVVVLPSTLVPAIGSAITALNATNSFPETADRSAHLAPAFDDIVTRLAAERPSNLPRIQTALKEAARLVVSDVDAWRDVLVRRRITRGG